MGSGDLGMTDVAAGKKRKKLVKTRLPQEVVDEITTRPVTPFPAIPDELLAGFSEKCRATFAMQKADTEKLMALDADIIRQYKDNGYAEVEEEVTDDGDGDEVETTEDNKGNGCPVKKRKKLVKTRLPQELVHEIRTMPIAPFRTIPGDLLAGFSDKFRAAFAMQKAETEKLMALDADIIRQHKDKGYTEVEEEVVIDDEQQQAEASVLVNAGKMREARARGIGGSAGHLTAQRRDGELHVVQFICST